MDDKSEKLFCVSSNARSSNLNTMVPTDDINMPDHNSSSASDPRSAADERQIKEITVNNTETPQPASFRGHGLFHSPTASEHINTPNVPTTSNVFTAPPKKTSFSNVLKASAFPKKDQAIIYPVIEGIQIRDYVVATGKVVGPTNVLFASRMSNNRVCIYLSSSEVVNSFVDAKGGVDINDIFVPARKLILPAKRIILSNVSPCIPHYVIEEVFKMKNIKTVSPISFIGAGIGLDEYRHVCSFRRQVFIHLEQSVEVPSSLLISFESEEYRIFLSDDKLKCFRCKEEGHIAANCSVMEPANIVINSSNKRPASSTNDSCSIEAVMNDSLPEGSQVPGSPEAKQNVTVPQEIKDSSEALPKAASHNDCKEKKIRKATKKRKFETKGDESTSEDSFEDIEMFWSDESPQVLDFCNFSAFLEQVKGHNKPLEVAKRYTDDIDGLIRLLKSVGPMFTQRAAKERCKRLTVSLKKAIYEESGIIQSPTASLSSSRLSLDRSSVDNFDADDDDSNSAKFY